MNNSNSAPENAQLDLVIATYMQQRERGETPDQQLLLQQHPHLAAALRSFFAEDARLQQLRPTDAQNSPTIIPTGQYVAGEEILGKYKLLELIGEGGMGAVWLAQQKHPVRRQVAIKLIRAGMDSRQVLARFDAERQALALMDHPHIARVLDGGVTERGRPFFVMEYIKGLPLTEYCDKAQLSLRERLQLFIPVCQAVQHAHLKGIVHRDLKPSNILVCLYDGRAVPKVIDFGLARALHYDLTDLSLHTSHGQMVGTPVYMSPEQAEFNNLDIDTRSDVYSLGVVLYELLTGLTPLDKHRLQKAAWDEMLRLIREEEPLPPSTRISGSERLPGLAAQRRMDPRLLQQSLIGELDWIVMRALEKERSRRYETSSGLARDIERYLADEAVEACPPSRLYRWRKFVRRHRPQVLAVGTLLLGLNAAIAGLAWGWQQSRQAEARVSQTLRELLKERAAKEQAVAEGQRERDLSRSKRAQSIIASIIGVSQGAAPDETLPSAALRALRQSFRAWSEIPNDAERVEVLEIGLTKPPESLILARHQTSVLQACVGISPKRRQAALKMLLDKQRCTDCAPEVRATACLLTLALGATETPALTEAAQVFQSHTLLMEDLQRQLWRRLPTFPEAAREAPLQLLLNSRVRYENPSDRQLDVPDDVRRLLMLGRIPCALDWYACLEPPATESWPIGLAGWYWNRLMRDLKTGAAVVPPDAKHPEAGCRGSHFLYRLIPALPDELLPVAASDMLDYLQSSISDDSDAPIHWTDFSDWMTALVQRLRPEHLPAIVQRLQTQFSGHSDPRALRVFSPLLQDILPRLSVQHRAALARLLFTCVRPSADWDDASQQTLSWTLGLAIRDLEAQEVEAFLQPFAAMPDGEAKTRATEVLVYVIHTLAPRMTAQAAGAWTKQLWKSLNAVAVRARLSGTRPYTGIPAALEVLAHRLEPAEWVASPEWFTALTQASEKPLSEDPIFLDTAIRTAPWLPPEVLLQFRTEILATVATPVPPTHFLQNVDASQSLNPAAAQFESELVDSRIALLGAVVRYADPAGDAELLQQLQELVEKSATPGRTTALIATAMQVLAGRGEPTRPRQLWNVALAALQRETWGIPYGTSPKGGRMLDIPRTEIDVWQKNSSLLERHVAPLLGVLAERLSPEDVGPAWDDLLRLLNLTTSDGFFTEWDHTRAELCTPALPTLAARTPAADCVRRLQELIAAARYERNTDASILSPFNSQGCIMFHAALEALVAQITPASAHAAAAWLTQNSAQHSAVILSLTWQSLIPKLDTQSLPPLEEHLFQMAMLTGSASMGPLPWRDLCLRLGPELLSKRWHDILRLLQASEDREATEQLCELLMACLGHVAAAERPLAVEPLLQHLEQSCRIPQASQALAAVVGIQHYRSIQRLRPEACVQDAIIRLANALEPAVRQDLAARCLDVALNCDADEDRWLTFREENFPAAVCGSAEQLVPYLNNTRCSGWIGESLLRRFEELTLHAGQQVFRNAAAGQEVIVIGPAEFEKTKNRYPQEPPKRWPEVSPRRFHDVADVGVWTESNRPEWLAGGRGDE